jgi:hypothetical protein
VPDTCPHCGFRLPAVVDAFCPECREPLDEPPEQPALARDTSQRPAKPIGTVTAVCLILGGLAGVVAGFLVGRNSFDRVAVWVPSLFAIVVGVWALGASARKPDAE